MDTYTDLPIETQRKELQKYVDSVKMLLGDSKILGAIDSILSLVKNIKNFGEE